MSYYFEMRFKDMKKEEILDFMEEIAKECREHMKEILKDNINFVPSQMRGDIDNKEDYSTAWKEADRYWLYAIFRIRFVYWEEYGLIGVQGCLPKNVEDKLTCVCFQNSTDQDYPYNTWDGVSYFEKVRDEIRNTDKSYFVQGYMEDEDEYRRKSRIYREIYDTLDLNAWLYGVKGDFKEYTIEAITSQKQMQHAYTVLQSLLWNEKGESKVLNYDE